MMEGLKVVATGYYVPSKIVSNQDFEDMIDTSDEWITSRTGIKNRHFVTDETTTDIGYYAAKKALDKMSDPERIGLIIVATMSPDYYTPSTACLLQERLGLNNQQVMAFDISVACSGFVYALTVANAMLKTMPGKCALVVGCEVLSKMIDLQDRGTCILFGDGAGAVIVENSNQMFISYNDSCGDQLPLYVSGSERVLRMNGRDVFKFAVRVVPQAIKQVAEMADVSMDEVDYVVCHQANERIIKSVYKKNGWDSKKFYMNIQEYGNTSGASIPLALAKMDEDGLLKPKMKILCVGFGGGLTWGATLFEW